MCTRNNKYKNQIIISGPCSIESKEQFFETCDRLLKVGINIIRGGVWKPRTKPGGFEGLGEIALKWMKEYKENHPEVKMCCEVANNEHTQLALDYNIDIIWVGARTTSDPFAVQDICNTIVKNNRKDIEVLIKNPACVDFDLWEGALLRFKACGINNLGLIHRGFKAYKNTKYRNNPLWSIALRMKVKYPDIPMICDPSHIAGNSEYIEEICKKAWMYNYDGFIIESHCNPKNAWTDASQQLTPEELDNILSNLFNQELNQYEETLSTYRKDIDSIDLQVLELLEQRFDLIRKIGELKKENNVKIFQPNRFISLVNNLKSLNKIPDVLVDEIWGAIHEESCNQQNKIINNEK